MDAVKFINERRRMCDSYNICSECPIHSDTKIDCDRYLNTNPENYVKTVGKWSAEHPVKTRQSEFLKIFPNAKLDDNGTISICPLYIEPHIKDELCSETSCDKCRKKYWLAEVK